MAVSFNELNTLPDILGTGRHELYFPNVPGLNSQSLMLTNTQVTLPTIGVGHIRARLLGHSPGFRGGLYFDNTLTCSFYELSTGDNIKGLYAWMQLVRNVSEGTSLLKAGYVTDGIMKYINTLGDSALEIRLVNVFPVQITYPEASAGDSAPVEFQVTFNVDSAEVDDEVVYLPEILVD